MTTTRVHDDVQTIYQLRFSGNENYRQSVWRVLCSDFFQRLVPPAGTVLDLGCGYGEFINQVNSQVRYAMDLNPDASRYLNADVQHFRQDCSQRWPLADNSLDVVFTSNFFEHLPDKARLLDTLKETHRCLRPGGRLIAMGPNIKFAPGAYWDFWDHYIPLTETSLGDVLRTVGFRLEQVIPRFLPYTMSDGRRYPLLFLRLYLRLPFAWRLFGRQFLVIATK